MEFYRNIKTTIAAAKLQSAMIIVDLPKYCASIYEVMHDDGDHGEVNCIWGVFIVHRELIKDGVRFTLPYCPNALAWTLTSEKDSAEILFHLTINRDEHEEEFLESIEQFVDDWATGLARLS